ncbi:MAG: hypothetical protein A2033_11075 [Bacteroidetes bacterium GWA2_31_9]|nr:MAG: hypothetical protein A2033_11075 [Bacteroidetes bacterium GWA2_31_9]
MKTVSIIIPCRNEEKYISQCIDSIINNGYDLNLLNIIICDGLSDDSTIEIINKYVSKFDFIRLIKNHKQTTQYALNLGIEAINSDIKIILGAHAILYPDYISKCVEHINNNESLGCVGGIIENVIEDYKTGIISKSMSSSFGVGNVHFRTAEKDGYVDTVAFGAYKNEVFEKIGLFDEELVRNQDDEFNFRLIKNGYKIYLDKTIKSKYFVRASFKKLFKQYYQYGYWKVFVNVKHKTITTIRQLIPLFFVLFLFTIPFSIFIHKYFSLFMISILSFYILISLVTAFKLSKNISQTLLISYSFLILHLSYGFGYLEGIFHFILLQKKPSSKSKQLSR